MPRRRPAVWIACFSGTIALALAPRPAWSQAVVETAAGGHAADRAGLRPGDVIVGWSAGAGRSATSRPRAGEVRTPFDLERIEVEEAGRGGLLLHVRRSGESVDLEVPPGSWRLVTRPHLPADLLERYESGRQMLNGPDAAAAAEGARLWEELGRTLGARGETGMACWLHYQSGESHARRGRYPLADASYEEAARCLAAGEAWPVIVVRVSQAAAIERRGEPAAAAAAYGVALDLAEEGEPAGLPSARILMALGSLARATGDLAASEEHHRRAHAICTRLAPDSVYLSHTLNNLGTVAWARGDLARAEEHLRDALELRRRIDPSSTEVSHSLNNLGAMAWARADYAAAEDFLRQALALEEARQPNSVGVAAMLTNLGAALFEKGDPQAARPYFERALAIEEEVVPDGLQVAGSLINLGAAAAADGDEANARRHLARALGIAERLAPFGFEAAEAEHELGRLNARGGDLADAERRFARALAIREALSPASRAVAESSHQLALVHRRQARPGDALALLRRAMDALDAQARRLGGADDSRGRFVTRHHAVYLDALDLLLSEGRPEEAFHVLERSRARGLLALLAERPALTAGLRPELAREREEVNAAYDRALAALGVLTAAGDEERRRAIQAELEGLRERQRDIQSRVRAAAPRLAALQHPLPLDLDEARGALDPETLLLSYAVGPKSTILFAVGPGERDFAVFDLPVGQDVLRPQVAELREQIARGRFGGSRTKLEVLARTLGQALLGPAASLVSRARRLLVVPDGPLHLLPFAALADPTPGVQGAWLVERRPLSVAASVTLYAELKAGAARSARTPRVVAFGDPVYPGAAAADPAEPTLRRLGRIGLRLQPLPASREEVEAVTRLYGEHARSYLGAEATEEAAKEHTAGAGIVHFACHGWLDDASPMDSALALSIPEETGGGRANGLLQAWEVFEQVRLDADLVTLSACGTGVGREQAGEGMLGLTRAFQYAGARTVLASLWEVSDATTAVLIEGFYRRLREGHPQAEALRRAQLDLVRGQAHGSPRPGRPPVDTSHPFYWAAFQLFGNGW